MKKHIPNTLTCCNLVCGCIATLSAFYYGYTVALAFIILGAVFDFFDGFVARLLHVSSPIGKELDSLADDITFGFAPAAVVFSLLRTLVEKNNVFGDAIPAAVVPYIPYVAFLIAAFSALRLAKFNLDERQTTSFIGLPTPANALFWAALAQQVRLGEWMNSPVFAICLLVGIFVSSWLLVAEIPMFALKFKTFAIRPNALRYGFIVFSLIVLCILGVGGFSAIIVAYVLCSLVQNYFAKTKD